MKQGPFGDIKKFSQKKRKENFDQSHKLEKCKRAFSTFILLQNIKNLKEDPPNFSKKVSRS